VFRAQTASGPKIVLSSEMAGTLVNVVKGAITLMIADEVPDGLKILKINGSLPGDEGYPLQSDP
jgi:hypothetical protein